MSQPVKAIVVDDHPLMLQATIALLEQVDGVEVVDSASDGTTCMQLVERHRPELVILDYQLPDLMGTEIAQQIKSRYPHIHIVIFTGVDITPLATRLVELQFSGVITKGTRHSTIKTILACILEDHVVIPKSVLQKMQQIPKNEEREVELTEDELTIMNMIVRGATLDQIAARIHSSRRSIDNYQRKIYDKFGVKTRAEALEKFIRSKYYDKSGLAGGD